MTLGSDGSLVDKPFMYSLQDTSTVLDLKEAFTKEYGNRYSANSIRMYFNRNGVDEPTDDSDTLEEVDSNDGFFVSDLPVLGKRQYSMMMPSG